MLEVPRVLDIIIENFNISSALDVGCGSGIFLDAFTKRGIFTCGIDLNLVFIIATREIVPNSHLAASYAEYLPFRKQSFDVVFMSHLLHESDKPDIVLKQAKEVCKKGIAILEWPYKKEDMGPPLEHRLKEEDVSTFAIKAGLNSIKPVYLKRQILYLIKKN
jgi:ubiquinone/menaquinone biosynthesis C-methylase UbiE